MIDFKNIINGVTVERVVLIIGGIVGVVGYLYKRRKDTWERRLPILRGLRKLLKEIEEEISCFAGGKTTETVRTNRTSHQRTYTSGDIKIHDGDEVFLNVSDYGGPLSWKRLDWLISEMGDFLGGASFIYSGLDRERRRLTTIRGLLHGFVSSLREFNERWPAFPPEPSIIQLEQKNKARSIEEAHKIETQADLIKGQIVELKAEIENAMRPLWF